MIPRDICVVKELPVLGTGKVDYVALGEWAIVPAASAAEDDENDDAA